MLSTPKTQNKCRSHNIQEEDLTLTLEPYRNNENIPKEEEMYLQPKLIDKVSPSRLLFM